MSANESFRREIGAQTCSRDSPRVEEGLYHNTELSVVNVMNVTVMYSARPLTSKVHQYS